MKSFSKNFEKNAKDSMERRTNEGSFGRSILSKLISICVFLINLVGFGANSGSPTKTEEGKAPKNDLEVDQNQLVKTDTSIKPNIPQKTNLEPHEVVGTEKPIITASNISPLVNSEQVRQPFEPTKQPVKPNAEQSSVSSLGGFANTQKPLITDSNISLAVTGLKKKEFSHQAENEMIKDGKEEIPEIVSFSHAVSDDLINNYDKEWVSKITNDVLLQVRTVNCEKTKGKKVFILTKPEVELKTISKNCGSSNLYIWPKSGFNLSFEYKQKKIDVNFTVLDKVLRVTSVNAVKGIENSPISTSLLSVSDSSEETWPINKFYHKYMDIFSNGYTGWYCRSVVEGEKIEEKIEKTKNFLKFFETGSESLRSILEYPFSDLEVVTANKIDSLSESLPRRQPDEVSR